jgi:hypothetical protein
MEQIQINLKFLTQHWPNDNVNFNMVYNMFSAFDLVETIQAISSTWNKKI